MNQMLVTGASRSLLMGDAADMYDDLGESQDAEEWADEAAELAAVKEACEKVRRQQNGQVQKLQEFGVAPENLMGARFEQFISYLVQAGVITELQLWKFNLQFDQNILETLTAMVANVSQQAARNALLHGVRRPTQGGLITPGH